MSEQLNERAVVALEWTRRQLWNMALMYVTPSLATAWIDETLDSESDILANRLTLAADLQVESGDSNPPRQYEIADAILRLKAERDNP